MLNHPRIFQVLSNLIILLALLIGSAIIPVRAQALGATIIVETLSDNVTVNAACSLREAITNANSDASTYSDCEAGTGNDTITFSEGLASGTIILNSSLPTITDPDGLTILGLPFISGGGFGITISGNNLYQVLSIDSSSSLVLDTLIIKKGASSLGSGITSYGASALTINNSIFSGNNASLGGAIAKSTGLLTIADSTFSGNGATTSGSVIYSEGGKVIISNSSFSNNSGTAIRSTGSGKVSITASSFIANSGGTGGALHSSGEGLMVDSSTFSNNTAINGGAIYSIDSQLLISNSTFQSNMTSGAGGGVYSNGATGKIWNSTFTNNSGDFGGGIYVDTDITITNNTIVNNIATWGGGIYNYDGALLNLNNTILANNSAGGDCNIVSGTTTGKNNLIKGAGSNACGLINGVNGNIIGSDPNLGSLTGSPAYFPLNIGSPAINTGDDAICVAQPVSNTSQNGVTRPSGLHCDIGSYELVLIPIFADVPYSYWANSFIERLYSAGITGGCSVSPLNYCPENTVTRDQMAIFLERGILGSSFVPPNVIPTFGDTAGNFAEDWIEALKNDGITGGCGDGNYCPTSGVTRAQMAIFLERSMHGASFVPPNVTPTFGDTAGNFAEDWIEALKNDGITSGCGNGNYCPDDVVTRAQMAVFLVKAFGLP